MRSRSFALLTVIALELGLSLSTATSALAIEQPSTSELVDGQRPEQVSDERRSQAYNEESRRLGALEPHKAPPSIITSKRSFSGGSPAAMRRRPWTPFQKSVQSSANAELLEGVAEG